MGKLEIFTIALQKPTPVYFAGENVIGTVNLRAKERFKINSIYLNVRGFARVHWTETRNNGKNSRTVHYSATEQYISLNLLLMTKQMNQQDLYLEFGDHSFPFQINLPTNLPNSFEHHFGRIRYSLHACVDIPWHIDSHSERAFTVLNHVDLNMNPALRQPYGATGTKVLCCGPCKSDPIIGTFSIPKTGYVPGETIVFNASIDNRSKNEIKELMVSVYQYISFHATAKTKRERRRVANVKYPNKIQPRTLESWNNIALQIPPVVASSNGTCRIIQISYNVVLNFDASGVAISKDIPIPITVGTIPLTNASQTTTDLFLPPSYQQCMFDRDPISSLMPQDFELKGDIIQSDVNNFKPIYPFYSNSNSDNSKNLTTF